LACEAGGPCVELPEANGPTYTAIVPEVGFTLRVRVTATGAGGSQTAVSEETAAVEEAPPANVTPPQITGSTLTGQKLTASTGEWSGSPTAYTYQWESCSGLGACTAINGATSPTQTLTVTDVGHTIRVLVTATGVGGTQTAISEQTATITEPASSEPTNCINSLAACGYPDSSSANVGPGVACSSLTPASGMTISKSGTTVENMNITGQVVIDASNVTLTHDCVSNDGNATAGSAVVVVEGTGVGAQVDYSDISGADSTSGSVEEAIRTNYASANTTADHDYIYNCGECFHGAGTLTNSYVIANAEINPGQSNEDHYEDIYDGGGGGPLIVNHNTMLNPHKQTAVVFASVDFGDQTIVTVTNNMMAGGDYVIYGGVSGSAGSVLGPVTVSGNRFSRLYYKGGGSLGTATYFEDSVTAWSGNVWDETLGPVGSP
jgi:hypothetical protein